MLILGIETSCDETSAAVVRDGAVILSSIVSSQTAVHARYFGVVPELASRAHVENINAVVGAALAKAGITFGDFADKIDRLAYVKGPGLAGPLLVGQITAQTLSLLYDKPITEVNHVESHLYAALLEYRHLKPPFLGLVASGGHTELILVKDFGKYNYLGGTRDDAAGEAFDKVAKLLDLGYPGGPLIDKLSKGGDAKAVKFPRPYLPGTWDFSFSGLKTSVLNFVKQKPLLSASPLAGEERGEGPIPDICASFQQAVVDTLTEKAFAAAREFGIKKIVLGGGVSANTRLRKEMYKRGKLEKIEVFIPSPVLCTDNAAMIACAGYYKFKACGENISLAKIEPGLEIQSWESTLKIIN
jgi:N6-L-threonylcarbamoyladenine synthase